MLVLECRPLEGQSGHEAGCALLRQLYEGCFGVPMPEIFKTSRGKPYFAEGGIHFSISHTKHYVFCALSDRPIGVDAEELTRQADPRLARKILSSTELAQYETAEDPNRALLTFWVLKEARAKCTGLGLQGYPNHTAFSLSDPRVTQQNGCLVAVIEEEDHVI